MSSDDACSIHVISSSAQLSIRCVFLCKVIHHKILHIHGEHVSSHTVSFSYILHQRHYVSLGHQACAHNHTWQVRDSRGRRVGRCKEWAKVVGDDQVDARVLAMRHKDQSYVPKVQQATKPERVMTYRSVNSD